MADNGGETVEILKLQIESDTSGLTESQSAMDRYFSTLKTNSAQAVQAVDELRNELAQSASQWDDPEGVSVQRSRIDAIREQTQEIARQNQALEQTNQLYDDMDSLRKEAFSEKPPSEGDRSSDSGGGGGSPAGALRTLGQILPGDAGRIARTAGEFARLDKQLGSLGDDALSAGGGLTELAAGLGPLAVAGIAVAAALALFKRQLDEAEKSLDEATQRQVGYYQAIETLTSDQIKAQLKSKQAEHDAYVRAQKDVDATVDHLDGFGKAVVAILGIIGKGPVKESNDLADKASKAASDVNTLNTELGTSEVAANDAAAAQKKLADETEKATEAAAKSAEAQQKALLGASIDGQLEYFQIIATGTKDSVEKALEQAQLQKKVAEQELAYLKAQVVGATGDQADVLNGKIKQLEQTLARDTAEVNSYTRALSSQSVAANDAAESAKKLGDLYKGIVDKQKSFTDASLKIEQGREKDILALQQREAQSEEDRLRQEGRDKARTARQQDFDARKSEADLDFAALADAADQRAFDAQEGKIKAQEDAEDRQIAHAREIESIDQRVADARTAAAATELDYMRQTVAEFAKLKSGYGDPRYYSDDQIKQIYGAAAGNAGAGYPPLDPSKIKFNPDKFSFDPNTTHRAGGGWLDPGQWSTVNEPLGQRESFDGMTLPGGKGLFFPLQGGQVTNNNHGGNFTIARGAINITGATDPYATAEIMEQKIEQWWKGVSRGG